MKTVRTKMPAMLAVMISILSLHLNAQDTLRDAATRNSGSAKSHTDTGFLNYAIKQHIIEFKLAEKALADAKHQKIRRTTRIIVDKEVVANRC